MTPLTRKMPASDEVTPVLPDLSPVCGRPTEARFDGGMMSSDGGLLVLRQIEQRLGIARRLAAWIQDPRAPERIAHGLDEIIRFRMLMIAAGYEDGNDADSLRRDPLFKLAMDRLPGHDIANLRAALLTEKAARREVEAHASGAEAVIAHLKLMIAKLRHVRGYPSLYTEWDGFGGGISEEAHSAKARPAFPSDDEVILQDDRQCFRCRLDLRRHFDVLRGRMSASAWMVVGEDEGCCVEFQRPLHDLSRIGANAIDSSPPENLVRDQPISGIEKHYPQLLDWLFT